MSLENVELTRSAFEAFERGDIDWMQSRCTSDVVIVQPPEIPDAKTYEGSGAIAQMIDDWPKQWEDFRLEVTEIIDVSDDVLVSGTRHTGRGRTSGIELDFEVFYVGHVRDGKMTRMEMFLSRERALQAAGMTE
ncbi:MAG TPA: nuclear transport factor 2 family protein [Solirubrobacteraceae bacterium]